MKRLSRILAVAAMAVAPLAIGGSAFADTCQISGTGPGSHNTCTNTADYTCTIKNGTDITVTNKNDQSTATGSANNSGNTSSGSATSGSATSSNGTSFDVDIQNGGTTCAVAAVTPPPVKPTQNPTPTPVGGKGATVKQPVKAPQKAMPAVLANTSGDNVAASLVTATGILAAGVVVSRLAVATYGRFKS